MESSSAAANVFSWSAAISACAKGSEWSKALGLFALMPEKRVAPNAAPWGDGGPRVRGAFWCFGSWGLKGPLRGHLSKLPLKQPHVPCWQRFFREDRLL